nr:MAG TPA: hypothetical protein [Caudoviricetes sp.]
MCSHAGGWSYLNSLSGQFSECISHILHERKTKVLNISVLTK